jgi:hypothetical protein
MRGVALECEFELLAFVAVVVVVGACDALRIDVGDRE